MSEGAPLVPQPEGTPKRLFPVSQVDFEIEFYTSCLERNPNYVEVLKVLSRNVSVKGDYQRAFDLDRRLVQLAPHDPLLFYNLACSACQTGAIDGAIDALKRAVDLGFDELSLMIEDRELEPIRKDPRFHELIAGMGTIC